MKRHLLAVALASAAALTVPALADATTYCVAKPECVTAGGTGEPDLGTALSAAGTLSPGQDRIEIGPGDFVSGGGFSYAANAGEGVDIVGSGQGVTRLLNSSPSNAQTTLKMVGAHESSVSDLTVVAPTPVGAGAIAWGVVTSETLRRVTVEGAHDYIAVQLFNGAKLEDSTIHGDAAHTAVTASGDATVSGTTIRSDGPSIRTSSGGTLDVSRTRIDAHGGPIVGGNTTLDISDSLVTTHGGPGLYTTTGVNTVLHASGDTIVGDVLGSAG